MSVQQMPYNVTASIIGRQGYVVQYKHSMSGMKCLSHKWCTCTISVLMMLAATFDIKISRQA